MARKKKSMIDKIEVLVDELLYEATEGRVGKKPKKSEDPDFTPMEFKEKKAVLDSALKFTALQNKIDPEDDTENDGIAGLRKKMQEQS